MSDGGRSQCQFLAHGELIELQLPGDGDPAADSVRRDGAFHHRRVLEDVGPQLPEDALVLDLGASFGNQAIFFSRLLRVATICVEVDPAASALLRTNVGLNGVADRVQVHGALQGAAGAATAARSLEDAVGARRVSLVWLDARRAAAEALADAAHLLRRDRPRVVASGLTPASFPAIELALRELGYRKVRAYHEAGAYLLEHGGGPQANSPARRCATDGLRAEELGRMPPTTQVVAGMATVAGNEQALRAAVTSLLPQVDRLYLYLNHFRAPPRFVAEHPKITWKLDEEGLRYGDAGKFWGLEQAKDAVYLTCDDDIVYPPDFAASMVRELAQLGGRAVVGVHGSLVLQPCPGYYQPGARAVFHFGRALLRRRRVHVVGTAAAAFHSGVVTMNLSDFERPNMADIWLARFVHEGRLPAYVIARPERWLVELEHQRPTIYQESVTLTGSGYDTAGHQDAVLRSLHPLSILSADPAVPATFVKTTSAAGVPAVIEAVSRRQRDPVFVLFDDSEGGALRATDLQARFACELHVVRASDPAVRREAYASLLARARHVTCCRIPTGGDGSSVEDLGTDAWRRALAA